MEAVNLTLRPVALSPVNGSGRLAPADGETDDYVRELAEVTDREQGLADAGIIELRDAAGRRRKPNPPEPPANPTGGDAA